MAAAKEPLEFYAKRPRPQEDVFEDSDEDDSGQTKDGFSLEEVLRLGGTKVWATGSPPERRGTGGALYRGRG